MRPTHVVESKVWRNKVTGQTASIYGSCPWRSPGEEEQWEIVVRGYTLAMSNGTIGYGQPPMKTREEAENKLKEWLERIAK